MARKRQNKYASTPTPASIKMQKEEEAKRKQREEMIRREEEKQREEMMRRQLEEERRKVEELRREELRRQEEQLKRQMEEERRKRAEEEVRERKRRIEEQVQRKLEEDRRKAQERQRLAEERRRKLDEEERERAEEEKRIREEDAQKELQRRLKLNLEETVDDSLVYEEIDLLGGMNSEEDEPRYEEDRGRRNRQYVPSEGSSVRSSSSYRQFHRDLPQRGQIDRVMDDTLDEFDLMIPVKKQGRNDGVYLFGGRVMKIKVVNGEAVVQLGAKTLSFDEFVFRFENVEATRMRGLTSGSEPAKDNPTAFQLCTFLGAKNRKSPSIKV